MSSEATPQCQQLKTNGTRCGSPAQRDLKYCYFHQRSFPTRFKVVPHIQQRGPYDILLPAFEDASSIQVALHQLTELIMRNRIDHKVAGLALYALQIASSNLKRMSQEIPPPAEVVIDPSPLPETDIAAAFSKALAETDSRDEKDEDALPSDDLPPDDLPPGTIQACQARGTEANRVPLTRVALFATLDSAPAGRPVFPDLARSGESHPSRKRALGTRLQIPPQPALSSTKTIAWV